MILRNDLIEIGKYNKTHGINGELSATLLCDIDVVREFSCLISEIDGIYVPFFVTNLRKKNSQTALLSFGDSFKTEDDAKILVNKDIFVLKTEYSKCCQESDEYDEDYPLDFFIGFKIVDENSNLIGEIVDIEDSTQNVLFVVVSASSNQEINIPAVEDFIIEIDEENQIIKMELPEGLLQM